MVKNRIYKQKQLLVGSTGRKQKKHIGDYINMFILVTFALMSVYPLIYVLAGSFSNGADYLKGGVYLFPRVFSIENYAIVVTDNRLWMSYLVTIACTVLGTITALLFTAIVAFPMSRPGLLGKGIIYKFFIFTMFFGGGLIPYFCLITSIGLFNNFWVYIIPALFSVYNMLVFVNFFKTIPEEIHESAVMDGASEFKIFFRIILPLSGPVLSTVGLWIAVGQWNSFYTTLLFINEPKLWTLQYYLMMLVKEADVQPSGILPAEMIENITSETVSLAAIMLSVIPIFVLYPLILKILTKGTVVGSLKG